MGVGVVVAGHDRHPVRVDACIMQYLGERFELVGGAELRHVPGDHEVHRAGVPRCPEPRDQPLDPCLGIERPTEAREAHPELEHGPRLRGP